MGARVRLAHPSNYRAGRQQAIGYIVLHYTGNDGDTAAGNAAYFAGAGRGASAHYFADEAEVWQSVPDGDTAWHCGAPGGYSYRHRLCRNANSIGIEMCSRKDAAGLYYIKPETLARAAALARELMARYGVPPENALRHFDVTGKSCPEPFVRDPAQWGAFRAALAGGAEKGKEGDDGMTQEQFEAMLEKALEKRRALPPSEWAENPWAKAAAARVFDGSAPQGFITREQASAVLDRLGLVKQAGSAE
jgi:N-acetylmuramoyl-L-alanine amidase CwlA